MSPELIFALVSALVALAYGIVSIKWILAQPEGNRGLEGRNHGASHCRRASSITLIRLLHGHGSRVERT